MRGKVRGIRFWLVLVAGCGIIGAMGAAADADPYLLGFVGTAWYLALEWGWPRAKGVW